MLEASNRTFTVKKLTLQQLEAHLWGAANILRGKTAGQDYKNYILSLMFFKRLCDQWEVRGRRRDRGTGTAAGTHLHREAKGSFPQARRTSFQYSGRLSLGRCESSIDQHRRGAH